LADLSDVMLALGKVQESVDRLRADFQDEKRSAHESRSVLHSRLDEQMGEIASLKTDVAISAGVDVTVREQIKALKATVEANHAAVQPSIEEWKHMKAMGIGLVGLLALGGLSLGAVLMWMSDAAVTAVRHWLKIP
jgi:predicted PP-loop superfamily ATPase